MTRASMPQASDMSEDRKDILIFVVIFAVLALFTIIALRFFPFPGYERVLIITETLIRAVSSQHDLAPLIAQMTCNGCFDYSRLIRCPA